MDVPGLGADDVLGVERAAMRLHDLPADRQAEARVLAEGLVGRAIGIEALENPIDALGADAGSVVLYRDDGMARGPRQGDDDAAIVLGHEGARVLDQVAEDLSEPEVVTLDGEIAVAMRRLHDIELDRKS